MNEMVLYKSRKKKAQLAGVGYFVLAFAAWPEMVHRTLFVTDDVYATSKNILSNISMFRISILVVIVTEIAFLFIALCLYDLLKEVKKGTARAMLSMVVIAVTMTILSTGTEILAINLFVANDPVHGFLMLEVFKSLMIPTAVFFGLWMLPLGYLFFKSNFMPKSLGIILMIGSSGYVIHAVYLIVAPGVSEKFILLAVVAEVATIVWLLAIGVKRPSRNSIPQ